MGGLWDPEGRVSDRTVPVGRRILRIRSARMGGLWDPEGPRAPKGHLKRGARLFT